MIGEAVSAFFPFEIFIKKSEYIGFFILERLKRNHRRKRISQEDVVQLQIH